MMDQKPLMLLKDYLEQDSGSESSSSSGSGFRCAPRRDDDTVRCLLEAELRHGGGEGAGRRQLVRGARSKSAALMKLSSVINVVKLLSFSSNTSSAAAAGRGGRSGGFSKRLIRGSFWKSKRARQPEETEKVRVRDIVPLRSSEEDADDHRSFDFPSPVASNCSSWSETASSASDFLPSSLSSSENLDDVVAAVAVETKKDSSPPSTPMPADTVAVRHRPPSKEVEEEEDKEQLSPVSVMDFPYDEEDDDEEDNDLDDENSSTASPSFNQSLANIERTKLQLLQKIRRFESLAELAGVDLEARFEDLSTSGDEHQTASEDESDGDNVAMSRTAETRAWVLLEELRGGPHRLGCFEKLLLDFFVQELRRSDEDDDDDDDVINLSRPSRSKGAEASMLRAARDWMRGDVDGRGRDAAIMEMEGNGRRRCHGEEEQEELGAELEEHVFGLLVEEMVAHLASS